MELPDLLYLSEARRRAADGSGRALRERFELTQREVADSIGTSDSRLSRWETGNVRRPRGQAAVKWAKLLAELERRAS